MRQILLKDSIQRFDNWMTFPLMLRTWYGSDCIMICSRVHLFTLLNIDTKYFEQMVGTIYPKELQLNKTNTSTLFLDLNLSIYNDIISITENLWRTYDFDFDIIVNFPFLDDGAPFATFYGVYISQLICLIHSLWSAHYKIVDSGIWCQHLISSIEGVMLLSIPTMWLFPDLFMMLLPQQSHKKTI